MIVAILGAGPAGMSCANACLSFGLTPVVIERGAHVGGVQRSNFHTNLWMLGSPGESGQALTQRLAAHFAELGVQTLLDARVLRVESGAPHRFRLHVHTPGGQQWLDADAVVICTGMRPRDTPELRQLAQGSSRVMVGALNDAIRDRIREAEVLILGGGDNALDHALFLAERGNRARVCTRGRFSGRTSLQEACRALPGVTLMPHCQPTKLWAEADGVGVQWPDTAVQRFDWLLVMYGYQANSEVVECFDVAIRPRQLPGGHIEVDAWQRTGVPGVYAAGDVTDNVQPAVPVAIAQGLAAAKAIEREWHRRGMG